MLFSFSQKTTRILVGWILFQFIALLSGVADNLKPVVLQLKWHHQFQFAGYYAAQLQGFYEQEGLELTFLTGENVDTVAAVLSEEADFGIALSDLVLSYKNDKPVVALATVFQHSPLVLLRREDSAAGSVHDMQGSHVMLEKHSEELEAYLSEMGVSVNELTRHPYNQATQSLLSEQVDAISAYITDEPFLLRQQGVPFHMSSPRSVGIDFYGDTLFTSRDYLQAHPDIVEKFRRASLRGWAYALDHPQELITYILQTWPEENSREALEYEAQQIQKLVRNDLVEIGYMNLGRWQHIAQVYADLGISSPNMDLEAFLYTSPRTFPLKKLVLIILSLSLLLCLTLLFVLHQGKQNQIQSDTLERLDRLQQKYSTLLMNMPGLAYRCHNDGGDWVMEYISSGAKELTGYYPEELTGPTGMVFGNLIVSEDAAAVVEEINQATTEKRRFCIQYRILHRNGETRWVWEQGMQVSSEHDEGMLEGFICDISDQKQLESEKEIAFTKLQNLLNEIKILKGIIPICSSCKKIRNHSGAWEQLEAYIRSHTEADFSHGICPDCVKALYPELLNDPLPSTLYEQKDTSHEEESG
ncbi:ABC transporter substrate-binding protein [Kiritimatiellota bacterium B12222]|nr:ABC transporter substrate-binding protein [Kiritimatiellota bacterium B12222]